MKYVMGIDLGTSGVKAILVDEDGKVCGEATKLYRLIQDKPGYCEQNPEEWVEQTVAAMKELMARQPAFSKKVEGISFSGQMHGLVLLNESREVLRPAILWNDTRTTAQCTHITKKLGERLQKITKNQALEGFTLPKLLWVKEHEPEIDQQIDMFLLPKDYVRFRLTGSVHIDYSDAAGTLLLNIGEQAWSEEICQAFDIPPHICPPLISSEEEVGTLLPHIAREAGLKRAQKCLLAGQTMLAEQLELAFYLLAARYAALAHLASYFLTKRIMKERFKETCICFITQKRCFLHNGCDAFSRI